MTPDERREAYNADITYGTNNEFGFDYLRDNMAVSTEHLVQRGHHYAIVDEVDSVLIDEARTPLIISGAVAKSTHRFDELKPRVERLVRAQTKIVNEWIAEAERAAPGRRRGDALASTTRPSSAPAHQPRRAQEQALPEAEAIPGVVEAIQRTEEAFMRDKAMWEADEDLYYVVEEKHNSVDLTEKGRDLLAEDEPDFFVLPDLATSGSEIEGDEELTPDARAMRTAALEQEYAVKNEQIHNVDQLLRAYSLYEKDDEYVIMEGKIMIVDEFTGRLMPGRRFSEGLHQALEAKEGVKVEKETQTLATITIQNYFRMYDKLAGMTGTAETEEAEFNEIYELDVVVIPTNRAGGAASTTTTSSTGPRRRSTTPSSTRSSACTSLGLPVLVGTTTVEVSETLSRLLKRARHQPQRAERQAPRARGGDRRRRRPRGRRDHRHQHGRPRHRHQAGRRARRVARALGAGPRPQARGV